MYDIDRLFNEIEKLERDKLDLHDSYDSHTWVSWKPHESSKESLLIVKEVLEREGVNYKGYSFIPSSKKYKFSIKVLKDLQSTHVITFRDIFRDKFETVYPIDTDFYIILEIGKSCMDKQVMVDFYKYIAIRKLRDLF